MMAYNEKLADRTREIISLTHKNIEEKKMFGGLCFMVNDKMCVGVEQELLMVRIDPARYETPEIYPEKMFDYDLGMYTVQYRKKGSDPINQLNYTLDFSIKSTSPTSAVLVMYSETPPIK